MKMLYLQSNNPNNYNTVKILNPLSKEDKFINYRVVNIATTCSFSLTTESDYIKFEIEEQEYPPIYFQDKGKYEEEDLYKILNKYNIELTLNDKKLFEFTSSREFKVIECSHRVKLLLGIYHMEFPIKSKLIEDKYKINCLSSPYLEQGPIFYLLARTDAISLTNARGHEETFSIIYKTNEYVFNGYQFVSSNRGNWFTIKSSQLQQLEFTLVDFMLEPIILHAPLYLTLEIREGNLIDYSFNNL